MEDFENTQGEYVEPISKHYRGFEVVECPPNGQGLTALIILNILAELGVPEGDPLSADRLHLEIEAARLAYQERNRYVADPAMADVPVMELLSREHTQRLCAAINRNKALPVLPQIDLPNHGDTVYLCVVDRDNNAVSMINSIYTAFGSGLTGPGSGVLLQNRGVSFCLDPDHVNCLAPQKRPMHTIIPGMLKKEKKAVMPFGIMGGGYQPMGHAHLLSNILNYGLNVQAAIDLARVYPTPEGEVEAEDGITDPIRQELAGRGHRVVRPEAPIGGGQAIWIDWEKGVLIGGSDPRKDGCALGF
jgi:gamma-glutamyltranspeptidase/glutathione hydrolase